MIYISSLTVAEQLFLYNVKKNNLAFLVTQKELEFSSC